MTLYTIGHSTLPLDDFLALLARETIARVEDVRRFPGSRRHPHFGSERLAASLAEHGVAYQHRPELGGRRDPAPDSPNAAWRNAGFRGYADYMATSDFEVALEELLASARETRTAIMCAEALPWKCHRSLIADAVVVRGVEVRHIMAGGSQPHVLTSFAVVREGRVSYPATAPTSSRQETLFDA